MVMSIDISLNPDSLIPLSLIPLSLFLKNCLADSQNV